MVQDALKNLGLLPEQCAQITGRRRTRLINFLLRWEQYETALACLEGMLDRNPERVGLLDAKARALQGLGRLDSALDVIHARNQIRTSVTSKALQARIQLARGGSQAALALAQRLVETRPDSIMAWELLGSIHLEGNDLDAAKAAFRQIASIRPHSLTYLRAMLALHQAQGDYVTASGYAVRIQRSLAEGGSLPATTLRMLRDYYHKSGELNRVQEINAEIDRLYQSELAKLEDLFGEDADLPEGWRASIQAAADRPADDEKLTASLPRLEAVPVSDRERQHIQKAVQRFFGYEKLLPGQAETIATVLRQQDVLTILPTGGGKSLCYQVPALLDDSGITLVISPLIALMKDQVDSLPMAVRRRATTINSSLDGAELNRRMRDVAAGRYRLVYAAPERLRQPPFVHVLRRCTVNRLVIDEAHCVSVWGHDFRPDYLYIDQARHALGDPPLLATTATAPPRVRRDILQRLGKRLGSKENEPEMAVIATEVHRANLQLAAIRARNADEKLQRLLEICHTEKGSGIIYAGTRARCERIAGLLRGRGISVTHYHAGIRDRAAVQDAFMTGQVRVVVATIAFGMGIDKADIRFIIHLQLPDSLEAYYQEVGRAGRDGHPARCTLIYSIADRGTLTRRARQDALTTDLLRRVYAAVRKRLGGATLGSVARDDLARDLLVNETSLRVALSVLEQARLLHRHQDAPRTAVVCLSRRWEGRTPKGSERAWSSFVSAARLRPGQALPLDLIPVAKKGNLDPIKIEEQLLAWAADGRLDYRPAGRNLLLELLPPDDDASARIETLLDRYATIQAQRVDEIAAYAATKRCRHGHISSYLSGQAMTGCRSCDNCQPDLTKTATNLDLPNESEQLQIILRCVATAPWSWGERSLSGILRASPRAPEKGRNSSEWGALGFRSQTAITKLLDHLVGTDLLRPRTLSHGGVVLDITPAGRVALADPGRIPLPAHSAVSPDPRKEPRM
jgi:ATP-dependent DNA helicase RecQ